MLENPQDESVVRWGDQGDSFVVLEVREMELAITSFGSLAHCRAERKIHKAYITQAFQAQQLCQFRQTT